MAGKRLLVREQLDGTIQLVYRERKLDWRELPERPERKQAKAAHRVRDRGGASPTGSKPALDHPWRRFRLS